MKKTGLRLVLAAALTMLAIAALYPQENKMNFNERVIKNLNNGINSENMGLRKSSIYLAGKYEIHEVIPALLERLDKESDASTRVLIALVLYKMGDKESVDAIVNLAKTDKDEHVRKMSAAILEQFTMEKEYKNAALTSSR